MGRRLVHAVPSSKMYSPHRHQQAEPHRDRVYHSRTITCSRTSAKYLGVTITDKVNWSQHIDSIKNKANRTLGFLRRNLKISSISIKEQAYKTLVRPLVEYASPVWDPHHQTDIRKLESV